ncbi:MAG: hypothetical protein IT445_17760 [Phycisphaeraceae bacterium]|nr:hypothetical protein [Phycisphaeraceae bacterium]
MIKAYEFKPWRPDFRDRVWRWLSFRTAMPMSYLAAIARGSFGRRCTVVAVTGSFGKTTVVRAILKGLRCRESTMVIASLNCFAYLYYQLLGQMTRRREAVLEVGIARPGQMGRYARVLRPDVAVVTGIGTAHVEYFPAGIEQLRSEKAELVRALSPRGTAVLNGDDPNVVWMAGQTAARVITFGIGADVNVRAVDVRTNWPGGTQFTVQINGASHEVRLRLVGASYVYAALSAIAVAHSLGRDVRQAIDALGELSPTPGRMEVIELASGATILLDDTKGTPPTLRPALEVLEQAPAERRLAVLGHLPRTAPAPKEPAYREMGRLLGRVLDRAYLMHRIDSQYEAYRQGLIEGGMEEAQIVRVVSVHDAADQLRRVLGRGDVLLIKAHIHDRLSRIALLLQDVPVRCRAVVCPRLSMKPCSVCVMLRRNFSPTFTDGDNKMGTSDPSGRAAARCRSDRRS